LPFGLLVLEALAPARLVKVAEVLDLATTAFLRAVRRQ